VKVRIRYSKIGKVRFVGNLDVTRLWERALRKASLPVAYSTGFTPRPRLSFGLALPMAAESMAEYVDIEFAQDVPLDGLAARLSAELPVGFDVLTLVEKRPGEVSLQEAVVACDWEVGVVGIPLGDAVRAVEAAVGAATLGCERERKGERRIDDVRPAIEELSVGFFGGFSEAVTQGFAHAPCGDIETVLVRVRLATTGRGVRPSELISVVFPGRGDVTDTVRTLWRTRQWIERDGARRELLPMPAAVAAPTELVGA